MVDISEKLGNKLYKKIKINVNTSRNFIIATTLRLVSMGKVGRVQERNVPTHSNTDRSMNSYTGKRITRTRA